MKGPKGMLPSLFRGKRGTEGRSFYHLFDKLILKHKRPDKDGDRHYVISILIRGGGFGKKASGDLMTMTTHYIDFTVARSEETGESHVIGALYYNFHLAIVRERMDSVGVSFPDYR